MFGRSLHLCDLHPGISVNEPALPPDLTDLRVNLLCPEWIVACGLQHKVPLWRAWTEPLQPAPQLALIGGAYGKKSAFSPMTAVSRRL